VFMVLRAPIAAASLPCFRASIRFGIAIAAMMAMIAMTIMSSMRVKPFFFRNFKEVSFFLRRPAITQGSFPTSRPNTIPVPGPEALNSLADVDQLAARPTFFVTS